MVDRGLNARIRLVRAANKAGIEYEPQRPTLTQLIEIYGTALYIAEEATLKLLSDFQLAKNTHSDFTVDKASDAYKWLIGMGITADLPRDLKRPTPMATNSSGVALTRLGAIVDQKLKGAGINLGQRVSFTDPHNGQLTTGILRNLKADAGLVGIEVNGRPLDVKLSNLFAIGKKDSVMSSTEWKKYYVNDRR